MDDIFTWMMLTAADKAVVFARGSGFAPPTQGETAEMEIILRECLTVFNAGLAASGLPDREPTAEELEQIDAVIEGAAQGAVLRVLGKRTPETN